VLSSIPIGSNTLNTTTRTDFVRGNPAVNPSVKYEANTYSVPVDADGGLTDPATGLWSDLIGTFYDPGQPYLDPNQWCTRYPDPETPDSAFTTRELSPLQINVNGTTASVTLDLRDEINFFCKDNKAEFILSTCEVDDDNICLPDWPSFATFSPGGVMF